MRHPTGRAPPAAASTYAELNRLFRQDYLIVRRTMGTTFAGWHDRVIAASMLLAALAFIRWWFVDRPWPVAAWTACAAAIVIGLGAGRLVASRLAFHAFDGLLAADALQPGTRRRYVSAWLGIGMVLLAGVTLIARPSLLVVSLAAYFAGALTAGWMDGVRIPRHVAGTRRPVWTMRAWSRRPGAGGAAAVVLSLSLLPARALGPNALMAVVGIETVLLAVSLTMVDHAIVRFLTIAGHGSRRIIIHHGTGLASFLAVAVPGCWIMVGPIAAGIVVAASFASLVFLSLRILAYRLHDKRFADFLVSILAGFLMLIAYSMPVALPLVVLAMLWQLHRRGRTRSWLLA